MNQQTPRQRWVAAARQYEDHAFDQQSHAAPSHEELDAICRLERFLWSEEGKALKFLLGKSSRIIALGCVEVDGRKKYYGLNTNGLLIITRAKGKDEGCFSVLVRQITTGDLLPLIRAMRYTTTSLIKRIKFAADRISASAPSTELI